MILAGFVCFNEFLCDIITLIKHPAETDKEP